MNRVKTREALCKRAVRLGTFTVLLCFVAISRAAVAQERQSPTKKVVVVHPTHILIPASMSAAKGMREALVSNANNTVVFEFESLDVTGRLGFSPREETKERNRLHEKYTDARVDLLVVGSGVALDFVLRNRSLIWPNTPVIYYAVSDRHIEGKRFDADVGGLTIHFDVAGTLALARQLQPNAREIVYVGGVAKYDQMFEPLFERAVQPYASQYRVTRLIGSPLSALTQQLAKLPVDSIVLYTSVFLDETGVRYIPADVAQSLSERSAAPIYGIHGSQLGKGIVGGAVIDYEEHGKRAGLLAADVLNRNGGLAPVPLAHTPFPSSCLLDARQMKRWRISARMAPANCEILFRSTPPWKANGYTLLLAAGALVALTGMGVALHNQARRRAAAESEATRRHQEMTHAARLALVGEISASIVHEVTQPLSAILSNAGVAEMLLDRANPSLEEIREILTDIRRDNLRAHQIVSRLRTLLKKRELQMDRVDVNELTANALAVIQPEARHRGVVVNNTAEPSLPSVRGDSVHLQQVLLNLLVNALDAMDAVPADKRFLDVDAKVEGTHAVCIRVRDSGEGIAAERLPILFDSFFTTKRNGMGLGLSIAKAIVDAHGGTLTAASVASGGAEFRLTLPLENH